MKALFNGRDITDKTVGKFQSDLSNTGDVNADGLIKKGKNRLYDFSKLKAGWTKNSSYAWTYGCLYRKKS